MSFKVIDTKTGEEPSYHQILKENWIKESGLMEFDIDQFFIGEDGQIILVDDCGNVAYAPDGRFRIVIEKGSAE